MYGFHTCPNYGISILWKSPFKQGTSNGESRWGEKPAILKPDYRCAIRGAAARPLASEPSLLVYPRYIQI
jgi:hypothetical protein